MTCEIGSPVSLAPWAAGRGWLSQGRAGQGRAGQAARVMLLGRGRAGGARPSARRWCPQCCRCKRNHVHVHVQVKAGTHLLGRDNGDGVLGWDGDVVRAVRLLLSLHRPAELRTSVSACARTRLQRLSCRAGLRRGLVGVPSWRCAHTHSTTHERRGQAARANGGQRAWEQQQRAAGDRGLRRAGVCGDGGETGGEMSAFNSGRAPAKQRRRRRGRSRMRARAWAKVTVQDACGGDGGQRLCAAQSAECTRGRPRAR